MRKHLNVVAGGLKSVGPHQITKGYAVITITGDAAEATSPLFFIQNNHTSAFDTSVLAYQPEEIATAP